MNTEEAWRAAHTLAEAANEATRAANRIEDAMRELKFMFEPGYGSSVFELIELLKDLKVPNTESPQSSAG
jgi:HPt (histidine-containing phosphotransfer) domain-containing protein